MKTILLAFALTSIVIITSLIQVLSLNPYEVNVISQAINKECENGGGTSNVTIINMSGPSTNHISVICQDGSKHKLI
jgi:hypothetical protein